MVKIIILSYLFFLYASCGPKNDEPLAKILSRATEESVFAPKFFDSGFNQVCTMHGARVYSEPKESARLPVSNGGFLRGGTLVWNSEEEKGDFNLIQLLDGKWRWIKKTINSFPTLCRTASTTADTCTESSELPLRLKPENSSPIKDRFSTDQQVVLWELFDHRGEWAFIEVDGKSGWIETKHLCSEDRPSESSESTKAFAMEVTPAKPDCYAHRRVRGKDEIRRIIVHNTLINAQETIAAFQRCARIASAHVMIDRDGTIYRFVEDWHYAFHAGSARNVDSLSIEMVAYEPGATGLTDIQRTKMIELINFWKQQYSIELEDFILDNNAEVPGYFNLEFNLATVSMHRMVSPTTLWHPNHPRPYATACASLIWENNRTGDGKFMQWRAETFDP